LQDNNICKLPNEIILLNKLTILNISRNNLKQLPEDIGQLRQLKTFDISHNKSLRRLPKSLGYAQELLNLNMDGLNLLYPPEHISCGTTTMIIAFMANECDIVYSPKDSKTNILKNGNLENIQTEYYNKSNDIQVL